MILLNSNSSPTENLLNKIEIPPKLNEKQRKQCQHEIKIYMEKYFKEKLGKGVDHTKIIVWEDMMIIRGEGFLTEPEKFIAKTEIGVELVNNARLQVAKQHAIDNLPLFESKLKCKVLYQTYMVDAEKDFWMHTIVFDQNLTE